MSGLEVMIELGLSYAESCVGDIPDDVQKKLKTAFKEYITEKISFQACCMKIVGLIGKDDPVVRLRDILELPEEPLPYHEDADDDDSASGSSRKKTRTWSIAEDQRLLAGVFHYGLENWQAVAQFLGSGRNRAQCSQRWTRGLNPRISKKSWTPEEDKQLESLVRIHGEKSWTKIASIMSNRSDVQCRYHYRQLVAQREQPMTLSRKSKLTMSSDNFAINNDITPRSQIVPNQNSDDEAPITLSSTRMTGSMPLFNLNNMAAQQTFHLQPIPIAPRISHIYSESPGPLASSSMRWGQTGVGQNDLDTFLKHFQ